MVSRPKLAAPRNKWKPTPTHFGLERRVRLVGKTYVAFGLRLLLSQLKVRKTQERGGGLNCVLKNFFVPYVEELFSGSESEVIQSLSEFRVVCSG